VLSQATIFRVTKEHWAQIGITAEFLIVVRTLGEFFRLRHVHGTNFSTAVAALYVGGGLIAACSCWAGVTFYFFRRYTTVGLDHASDSTGSAGIQNCRDRLVVAAIECDDSTKMSAPRPE
jgi:hypothetical protein